MITREKPNKRRNLLRWQENRLRRLDLKIEMERKWVRVCDGYSLQALTPAELNRCRDRAHRLACDIQIEYGKQGAEQFRKATT